MTNGFFFVKYKIMTGRKYKYIRKKKDKNLTYQIHLKPLIFR